MADIVFALFIAVPALALIGMFVVQKRRRAGPDKGAITRKIVLWLSTDAKPYGLVASSTEQSIGGGPTVKIEGELAGLGNGDKASWGKKAEELDLK